MEPLTWVTLATLLAKYGPEMTDFIVSRIHAGNEVTPEEWAKLRAMALQTPESQLREAMARAGITEENEHAKNLLSMVK